MRPRTRHVLLAALLAVSACVPPTKPAPAPPPAPPPAPAPMPTPTPSPTYTNWEDAPQTPGDWSYAAGAATFCTPECPLFIVRCSAPGVTVQLVDEKKKNETQTWQYKGGLRDYLMQTLTASPPWPWALRGPARRLRNPSLLWAPTTLFWTRWLIRKAGSPWNWRVRRRSTCPPGPKWRG